MRQKINISSGVYKRWVAWNYYPEASGFKRVVPVKYIILATSLLYFEG